MLDLLQDIATDPFGLIGPDNPLRQVIVNTHSPAVVAQIPEDALLMAETKSNFQDGARFDRLSFRCLPNTWRASTSEMRVVSKGQLMAYLNPVEKEVEPGPSLVSRPISLRVIVREDLQLALFGSSR